MDAITTNEQRVIQLLHYVSPLLVFLYFLGASAWSFCTLQTLDCKMRSRHSNVVQLVMLAVVIGFVSTVPALGAFKAKLTQ